MNEKIKKFIAFASAAAMFVCLINPEISFAASDTRASVRIGADQPEAGRKALSFDNFNIPLSAGKITSSHYYGSPYTVINIQDLHCHPQVQRNIAKIIDSIDKQYALDKVYLEGASTNAASGSLSDFMKTEIGKDVVETLVDEGYISGTEYYSLINEKNEIISAIEEKEIYDANIELLNAIISAAPKVEEICLQMLKELSPVIKEYSNSDARKLERIIRRHENKKIDSGKYYLKLIKFAKEKNIDVSPYKNISAYAEFSNGIEDINRQKVSKQMGDFLNILKSKFSYEEFNRLSAKSANFSNLEDIASDLVFLSEKYSVFENNKFYELQKFFTYLRFLTNVNPMEFADEEKAFVEELKLACVADEYEAQIVFLADFIPEIKRYFTANITPQELEAFDARFKKFKEIWCSYFSENSWRELDKYADILKQYHANNIKRDKIFSDIIVRGGKPGVKVMVTGGFHSKGLEEFLQKNAVNYILITPKVNGDVASAYETYLNVIKSYKSIIKNAINIKPFYENAVNESLPNLIGACFKVLETKPLTLKAKEDGVKEYINIYLNSLKDIGGVYVSSWQIDEYSAKEIKFSVTYADKRDLSVKVEKTYTAKNGKVQEIKQSGGSSSNSSFFNPLSIINPFFKNTKTKSYRFYTFIVIPVLEEFVFRFSPFTAAGFFFAESMLFAPFAITIAGMLLFAWGHKIADDIAFKTNSLTQKRNYFSIGVLGLLLSGVYSALFIIFPSAPWIALTVTLSLHSINNILSYLGIIKNPMLSMIKQNTLSDKPETAVKKYLPDTVESLKKVIDSPYFNDISPQLQEKYKDIVSHFEELVDLDNNYDLLIEASELAFEFISSLESQAGIEEKYIRIVLTKLIVMSLADIGGYIYGKDGVSFLERLKDLLEKNKYYVE
ncbi:MAG: hypothetical protein LBQ47_00440, partial [Endomicrobium sp.]|nr:hypothetical protein [Endomicrobium sp.]